MKRYLQWSILMVLIIATMAVLWLRPRPTTLRYASPLHVTASLTNAVEQARIRVTGGVGLLVGPSPASGLPEIAGVAVGSPADRAGLRQGDLITLVNGQSTAGRPMSEITGQVRGITGGTVEIAVNRKGTNLTFIVPRSSWKSLRALSYNPYD